MLKKEQPGKDGDGHGNNQRTEAGGDDLDTLDSAEHRDRRRNHTVAIEQRRTKQAETDQNPPFAFVLLAVGNDQSGQCQNPPLRYQPS